MKNFPTVLSIALVLSLFLVSCKKENTETQVSFLFNHFVGAQELEFDTIRYQNAFGNNYSVSTLKYFVSNLTLHSSEGEYFLDDVLYIDAREQALSSIIPSVKVPVGNYTKLTFTYGLDSAENQSGMFPNPPENLMEWPIAMGGGYHYMKLEGKVDSSGVINNFQAHTGPTMGNDNSFEVTLDDANFSCSCETKTITIEMDINQWWTNPNTLDLNVVTGIMGNQPMQEILKTNGSDVFSAKVN